MLIPNIDTCIQVIKNRLTYFEVKYTLTSTNYSTNMNKLEIIEYLCTKEGVKMFMLLSNDVKQPIIEELESKILTDEFMNTLLINLTARKPHSAVVVPVLYDDSLFVDTDSVSRVQNDKLYLAVRVHYEYDVY